MPNHGPLRKDIIGGSLQINSKIVLDEQCNLRVANAKIKGDMKIDGDSFLSGNLKVYGATTLCDGLTLTGDFNLTGDTTFTGNVEITGFLNVGGDTNIGGSLIVTNNITGDMVCGNSFCTPDWVVSEDVDKNLNFAYGGNVEAQIMPDGVLCGRSLAVSHEEVVASLGLATLDGNVGVSLITGDPTEGTTDVTLPDPTNTKAARLKHVIAGNVAYGVINVYPTSWGPDTSVGVQFDTNGDAVSLIWLGTSWWCVGNCGATVILPP